MKMVTRTILLSTLALGLAALPLLADTTTESAEPELHAVGGGTASPAPAAAPTTGPASEKSGEAAPGGTPEKKPSDGGILGKPEFLLVIIAVFFLMYFWMGRSKRKQESKRKEMLNALKKGDRITTIGGIIGTVIEVKEDEVTIKVDDSARVKFARWAIRGVGEEAKSETPDDKKK